MVKLSLVVMIVAACQGGSSDSASKATEVTPKHGSAAPKPPVDAAVIDAPEDPDKALAELHAVPAWDAVVDRALYLARRGQHGVVYGTLGGPVVIARPAVATGSGTAGTGSATGSGSAAGSVATGSGSGNAAAPESPYTWLVDDTDGNGALAIKVLLGKYAPKAKQGDRIAVGGAWALDDTHHYYWKVDALQTLPPAKASDGKDGKEAPVQPGHVIATGDFPAGVKRISLAKEGDLAYFQVVGMPPTVDGDGWPVADELGNPVVALLVLPGERASYGAQDMRTPDERWQLKRGQTYWVRIGRFHKRGPDKPPSIIARTAPVWVR